MLVLVLVLGKGCVVAVPLDSCRCDEAWHAVDTYVLLHGSNSEGQESIQETRRRARFKRKFA